MSGLFGGKKEPLSCRRGEDVEIKSIFGRYSDAEMLAQLKDLAPDPCNFEFSLDKIRPLWNQVLRARKFMALKDTAFPWRKRKLEQFCKDKLRVATDVPVPENDTKLSRGELSQASCASCLLNSAESAQSFNQKIMLQSSSSASLLTLEDSFREKHKQMCLRSSSPDDAMECRSSFPAPFADSDESVNGSNPLTPENLNHLEAPTLGCSDSIHTTNSTNPTDEMQKNLHKHRRSTRPPNFIGDHLERKVIPVGPRFQVDVPEWTGPIGNGNYSGEERGSEDSRWLGTRIWPIDGVSMKTTGRAVGKGRPSTCSCVSPGCSDCIKRHILEERLLLQCDLGAAFFTWKFDEMGEQAAKSWTLKEEEKFEALVKMNSLSKRKKLMKHAFKSFPHKSTKAIASYYFNVIIPRHIGQQTRLSPNQVTSDEEEGDGFDYLNHGKKCEGRTAVAFPSGVKKLYLRRPS